MLTHTHARCAHTCARALAHSLYYPACKNMKCVIKVRRCLKPQQRVPPEWSSTEAAADERAGKAEMMQRFIEVTLQQQQVNAASPETDSAFCSDNISLPSSGSRASVMTNSSQGSAGSGGKDQTDKGRDKEQANGKVSLHYEIN